LWHGIARSGKKIVLNTGYISGNGELIALIFAPERQQVYA
jgi:hypothetical protein